MNSNPILVEAIRGNLIESFHRGVVCIVDENKKVLYSTGDIHQICYPRSAMKLLQVIALIECGAAAHYNFNDAELAVMCGSHNAEPMHIETVKSILQKIDLSPEYLQCGAHFPMMQQDYLPMYKNGIEASDIHNNCSGKHAGFLALCKFNNWSTQDYLLAEHPAQQLIKKVCSEMYECDIHDMHYAIDGCSAPIYSVSVYHQAIGYMNLVNKRNKSQQRADACAKVVQAVSRHPEMVAGTQRYCTDMMKRCSHEVIGKTGAEGIFCMAFVNTVWGVCIKIDDGKMQPQYNVAQTILEQSHLFDTTDMIALQSYSKCDIKNWNQKTSGVLHCTDSFEKNIQEFFSKQRFRI